MYLSKKFLICLLTCFIVLNSSSMIFAHETVLNALFDECIVNYKNPYVIKQEDGYDEIWYYLSSIDEVTILGIETQVDISRHLNHETKTIKYYFSEQSKDDVDYTWETDIYAEYRKTMSEEEAKAKSKAMADEIKEAYAISMKKWNNVYYYTYDSYGNRVSKKIIDIVEGTADDHNLIIYPINYREATYAAAVNAEKLSYIMQELQTSPYHFHCTDWYMNVNVSQFFTHEKIEENSEVLVDAVIYGDMIQNRERVGMHEVGHILGLRDVDIECQTSPFDHHEELLMGYGDPAARDVSYKDIAGVSITRGFHTDEDHAWMLRTNTDGTQDVICAQCNGVRYDVTLTDGKYEGKNVNIYQSCVHHGGTNQKMLLVATDGERDFFKCQYCRKIVTLDLSNTTTIDKYVQTNISKSVANNNSHYQRLIIDKSGIHTFKAVELENLSITLCDDNLNDTGLITDSVFTNSGSSGYLSKGTYYLKIENSASNSQTSNISVTPPPHTHNYTEYAKYSSTHHIQACECGATGTVTSPHVVKSAEAGNRLANCMLCGQLVLLDNTIVQVPGLNSITQVTPNGSYILPNGIIVLVDSDIESYLNGTLVFYDKDDLPVVQ